MKKFLGVAGLSALVLVCGCETGTFINGRLNPVTNPKTLQPTTISLSANSFDFGHNIVIILCSGRS